MQQHLSATIHGRVQGVNFRNFVKKQADSFEITGYAMNTPNGTVQVEAEGEKSTLVKFTSSLMTGPRFAKVEFIESDYTEAKGEYNDFKIIRDKRFIKDQIKAYRNFAKGLLE